MAILAVTGGAGFVGSHLVERLLTEGHDVFAIDNFVTGSPKNLAHLKTNPKLRVVEQNISQGFPEIGRVDGIFHLASPASPEDFVRLAIEIMKVGSLGTLNTLDYAKTHRAWMLLASTSEVYGDPLVHPQQESYFGNVNPIGIRGVYDESKRFSEALVMAYHRTHQVKTSIVRIFNTYGPRMRPDDGRVVSNFICQALTSKNLTIQGDGHQTRSFCYVDDLVEGLYRFYQFQPTLPVNLGNDLESKVIDIAKAVLALLPESKSQIEFKSLPQDDPKRRKPDLTRAHETLQWAPRVLLHDGLKKTIDYFQAAL